jgi:hypothetical protein
MEFTSPPEPIHAVSSHSAATKSEYQEWQPLLGHPHDLTFRLEVEPEPRETMSVWTLISAITLILPGPTSVMERFALPVIMARGESPLTFLCLILAYYTGISHTEIAGLGAVITNYGIPNPIRNILPPALSTGAVLDLLQLGPSRKLKYVEFNVLAKLDIFCRQLPFFQLRNSLSFHEAINITLAYDLIVLILWS